MAYAIDVPDLTNIFSNSTTGVMDTIYAPNAYNQHAVVVYFSGDSKNITRYSILGAYTCNSTNTTYGNCSALNATSGENYTINESTAYTTNTSVRVGYNMTINITNNQTNSTHFNISIYAGNFWSVNTGIVGVSILNNDSTWVSLGSLESNTLGWVNASNLSADTYSSENITQLRFSHDSNSSASNIGAVVDYIGISAWNYTAVSPNATVTMYGSIDNVNWINFTTMSNITAPVYFELKNLTKGIRFTINSLTIGNNTGNNFKVSYLGIRG